MVKGHVIFKMEIYIVIIYFSIITCLRYLLIEGEWENDKMNGYGVYTFADKSRYEGIILKLKFEFI